MRPEQSASGLITWLETSTPVYAFVGRVCVGYVLKKKHPEKDIDVIEGALADARFTAYSRAFFPSVDEAKNWIEGMLKEPR